MSHPISEAHEAHVARRLRMVVGLAILIILLVIAMAFRIRQEDKATEVEVNHLVTEDFVVESSPQLDTNALVRFGEATLTDWTLLRTYQVRSRCRNCGELTDVQIPFATVPDFTGKVCLNCGLTNTQYRFARETP